MSIACPAADKKVIDSTVRSTVDSTVDSTLANSFSDSSSPPPFLRYVLPLLRSAVFHINFEAHKASIATTLAKRAQSDTNEVKDPVAEARSYLPTYTYSVQLLTHDGNS